MSGGNALPVPALGLAAETAALAGMAIALASVFGQNIGESVAKAAVVNEIKKTLCRKPVKAIVKDLQG